MAHRRVGPRLIPAFPNEISDLILYELSSHELTIDFFVSLAWQDFLAYMSTIKPASQTASGWLD
jgi:hypothetical protein